MGECSRRVRILLSVMAALIALLAGPAVAAHADDVLPTVRFTTTSGAPLQNGATYGIGTVIVAQN